MPTFVDARNDKKRKTNRGAFGQHEGLIVHHTAGNTLDLDDIVNNQKVQFVIDRDGTVYQTMNVDDVGAHAPNIPSRTQGRPLHGGLGNRNTIGVEIVAEDDDAVNMEQMQSLNWLHGIKLPELNVSIAAENVLPHPVTNTNKQVVGEQEQSPEGLSNLGAYVAGGEGMSPANFVRAVNGVAPIDWGEALPGFNFGSFWEGVAEPSLNSPPIPGLSLARVDPSRHVPVTGGVSAEETPTMYAALNQPPPEVQVAQAFTPALEQDTQQAAPTPAPPSPALAEPEPAPSSNITQLAQMGERTDALQPYGATEAGAQAFAASDGSALTAEQATAIARSYGATSPSDAYAVAKLVSDGIKANAAEQEVPVGEMASWTVDTALSAVNEAMKTAPPGATVAQALSYSVPDPNNPKKQILSNPQFVDAQITKYKTFTDYKHPIWGRTGDYGPGGASREEFQKKMDVLIANLGEVSGIKPTDPVERLQEQLAFAADPWAATGRTGPVTAALAAGDQPAPTSTTVPSALPSGPAETVIAPQPAAPLDPQIGLRATPMGDPTAPPTQFAPPPAPLDPQMGLRATPMGDPNAPPTQFAPPPPSVPTPRFYEENPNAQLADDIATANYLEDEAWRRRMQLQAQEYAQPSGTPYAAPPAYNPPSYGRASPELAGNVPADRNPGTGGQRIHGIPPDAALDQIGLPPAVPRQAPPYSPQQQPMSTEMWRGNVQADRNRGVLKPPPAPYKLNTGFLDKQIDRANPAPRQAPPYRPQPVYDATPAADRYQGIVGAAAESNRWTPSSPTPGVKTAPAPQRGGDMPRPPTTTPSFAPPQSAPERAGGSLTFAQTPDWDTFETGGVPNLGGQVFHAPPPANVNPPLPGQQSAGLPPPGIDYDPALDEFGVPPATPGAPAPFYTGPDAGLPPPLPWQTMPAIPAAPAPAAVPTGLPPMPNNVVSAPEVAAAIFGGSPGQYSGGGGSSFGSGIGYGSGQITPQAWTSGGGGSPYAGSKYHRPNSYSAGGGPSNYSSQISSEVGAGQAAQASSGGGSITASQVMRTEDFQNAMDRAGHSNNPVAMRNRAAAIAAAANAGGGSSGSGRAAQQQAIARALADNRASGNSGPIRSGSGRLSNVNGGVFG